MSGDDSGAGDAAQAGGELADKAAKGAVKAAKTGVDVGRVVASGGTDVKAWLNLAKTLAPIIIGIFTVGLIAVTALIMFFFGGGTANASTCQNEGSTSLEVLATNGPINVGSPYTYPSSPPSQGTISAEMMGYAQLITRIALERTPPAPEDAIMIAIATALVESKLSNPTVATDHDSLGLFQQRPSQGWGSPEQVTDPQYSVNKFLDRLFAIDGWNTVYSPGGAAQKVQGSAHPDRYDAVMATAAGLVQSILPVIQTGGTNGGGTTDPASPSVSSAYVLGDSITVQAEALYTQMFARQGASTTISAVVGRSWNTPGNPSTGSVGTEGTGKAAAAADQQKIKDATVIVIALGTNGGILSNPPDEVVETIRGYNETAPIYWVNIAGTAATVTPHVHPMNEKLDQLDLEGKINLIDWAAMVDPGNVGTHDPQGLLSDGVHPTVPTGINKLMNIVEFTFVALQGINVSECEDYTGGNGGDPSDCPPDTFFNPTTLRVSQSAHELCVKSVQQARSPEAGKAIIWAFHHVGIPYGRPDGVCSTNTTRTGPDHYDCSGFTTSAYSQTGTNVGGNPTTSTMRGNWPQAFRVTEDQARPGDFYLPSTGHVTMLLADGNIVHSSRCGDVSHIRTKYSGNYNGYYAVTTPSMITT